MKKRLLMFWLVLLCVFGLSFSVYSENICPLDGKILSMQLGDNVYVSETIGCSLSDYDGFSPRPIGCLSQIVWHIYPGDFMVTTGLYCHDDAIYIQGVRCFLDSNNIKCPVTIEKMRSFHAGGSTFWFPVSIPVVSIQIEGE